ncbi:hypothetical protein [Sphingomonas sp.]|uniref:hypothetical protein n=1 Tax=Sphingomonas sp. TaxID=28214 RepID=UPI00286DD0AE|nr:hypothetical protein [Sphingomonas sp.]
MTPPEGPPRPPFVLSVGVTGHRNGALGGGGGDALRGRIGDALALLADAAEAVRARGSDCFVADATRLQFVSPLADGADQIAAEAALERGYTLHAVLPFGRADYRASLADEPSRARFDALLARAACALELPGEERDQPEAYVMTGRATVAHCDVLLAVWDGLPPRGRGGTAEVVQQAIVRGTPVLHVPVDAAQPARLLWAAFDPAVLTQGEDAMAERPFTREHAEHMLEALLLPPADPQEHAFLAQFAGERARRIRARIEYPLLLAAAGVKRFRPGDIREARAVAGIEEEWRHYREQCEHHLIDTGSAVLEAAYSWADRLATHFAQTYRSGHVFNFVLGGLAVCLGLSSFMWPHLLLPMAVLEFLITLAIIANTRVGVRNQWHRRWLDYRQLAERLRPMRSLKLLGIAAPDPPGTPTNPVPRRWIDWYASGMWRAMGCPAGAIDPERARQLAASIAALEVAPQVAYHDRSSGQINLLDQRLESIAAVLFWATLIVCVATVLGRAFAPDLLARANNWFTLIGAGFPAIGTAVFGIRFQGDFGGSALRSQATANALRQIDAELSKGVGLNRAADLAEQAARTMLSDLDEWRLVNQQQDLGMA